MRRVVLRKTQGYFQLLYDVVGDVIGILEGALVHAIGEVSFKWYVTFAITEWWTILLVNFLFKELPDSFIHAWDRSWNVHIWSVLFLIQRRLLAHASWHMR